MQVDGTSLRRCRVICGHLELQILPSTLHCSDHCVLIAPSFLRARILGCTSLKQTLQLA